jgi:hypothetical protein
MIENFFIQRRAINTTILIVIVWLSSNMRSTIHLLIYQKVLTLQYLIYKYFIDLQFNKR